MSNSTLEKLFVSFNYYFNMSTAAVLTGVGMIGNSLVLFVFTRKKFRNISMFRYYSFVTTFEILQIPFIWVYYFPDFFSFNENELVCKLIQFSSTLLLSFVAFMQPIISIDRFFESKYPKRFFFRNKFNFQLIISAGLLLGSSIVSIPFYYYDNIYFVENSTECSYNENSWIGMEIDISVLIISLFVPFIISITFSCLTAYHLIQSKKRLQIKNFKKEKRLLKILISMDVFLFICNLPWCVYIILKSILNIENMMVSSSMIITYDISNFLFYVYQSFSFFVYFLSNKQFRIYILKLNLFRNIH